MIFVFTVNNDEENKGVIYRGYGLLRLKSTAKCGGGDDGGNG